MTSIIGTEIWGSSSRGVARMPSNPAANAATVTRGVSLECRNGRRAAQRNPWLAAPDENDVTGPEAREDLDHAAGPDPESIASPSAARFRRPSSPNAGEVSFPNQGVRRDQHRVPTSTRNPMVAALPGRNSPLGFCTIAFSV
jgi:hypothetical protein